jgi:uncharacterized integral membrane protein (TIGR00698 family)
MSEPASLSPVSVARSLTGLVPGSKLRHLLGCDLLPGLVLTFSIAALAYVVRQIPGVAIFSPLIIAIILGMAFRNLVGAPAQCHAGVTFSLKRILRFAIILLGLQLTVGQVVAVGGPGVLIIVATLVATFVFTTWLGRALGVDRKLAQLIAAGTSICGASAVIATNTVTKGSDEDVAYAVACVTLFGSLSMFLYPLLPALLHLDPHAYGLWSGASIHEIAQVVAAAFQNGKESGDFGTIAKLSRVILLAPVVLTLGWAAMRTRRGLASERSGQSVPMPWFVLGFIALTLFNSLDVLPLAAKAWAVQATTFLLTVALAAMGLQADIRKLKAKGLKPLLVGAGAWVFISVFSLGLIELMY